MEGRARLSGSSGRSSALDSPGRAARSATPTISVVIPARNEARNLELVLPELPDVDQIVLVDGHSVDGTMEVAKRTQPDVTVLQQTRTGKGNALACGFAAATGDIIVMFDADGSADPAEIALFVDALMAGADFAKGTRFSRHGGSDDITAVRKAGNWVLNRLSNALFRTRFSDLCYGYNAFWRDVLPMLNLPPISGAAGADNSVRNCAAQAPVQWGDGFEIETLLSCRVAALGLSVTEVPSVERPRMYGDTHLRTFSDGARVLRTLLAERRRSGRRAGMSLGARNTWPPGPAGTVTAGNAPTGYCREAPPATRGSNAVDHPCSVLAPRPRGFRHSPAAQLTRRAASS
ncbi:MAG: glycosyltransferase family 2 protein [Pseudonocardiaceae bacterium]